MKNQEFRKYPDNRYLALTGETAPKLPDLFIGFEGDTPAEVKETVIPRARLPEVVTDVPDEWKAAFRPHGFTFEEEAEIPVLSGIDGDIDYLKKQIELEKLTRQLVAMNQVETVYANSFDISFWWFLVLVLGGAYVFAATLKLLV